MGPKFQKGPLTFIYCLRSSKKYLTHIPDPRTFYFLSDRIFNQKKVGDFEASMRSYFHAYYYNEEAGLHYDQFEIIVDGRRICLSNPMPIELSEVPLNGVITHSFPFSCRSFRRNGLLGDLLAGKDVSLELLEKCLNYYLSRCSKINE